MASAIERSVRRALLKGNAADPAYRVKVYEAAERAMLRVVAEKNWNSAVADRQREELMAAVEAIEADYPPVNGGDLPEEDGPPVDEAVSSDREVAPAAVPDADASAPRRPNPVGRKDGGDPPSAQAATTLTGAAAVAERSPAELSTDPIAEPDAAWSPGGRRARPAGQARRRLVFASGMFAVLLLLATGTWFILAGGEPDSPVAEREVVTTGSRVRASPPEEARERPSENWIEVFAGGQIERVAAENGGRVTSIDGVGSRAAVQIERPAGVERAEIALLIGPGIVENLAGRTARGELTVGSPDETPREFTIRCLFAGETICGRQRFSTSVAEETFVFDMDVPASAGGSARLAIDPGMDENARDLNIYGFRLRPLQ